MPVRGNSKQRLGEKAYQQIRERIVTLGLRPGEQVDEAGLEKQLSIGRTPIREALHRLVGERLLEAVPGRGFFVTSVSIDDVKSLFEALTAMERIAVRLAAQRIRKDEIRRMAEISERHKAAMARKDYPRVSVLNSEFHRTFYAATRNTFLGGALDGIYNQAERIAYLSYTKEAHPQGMEIFNQKAIEDHEALIACFAEGDAERAVEVITAHCRRFFLRTCYYMEPKVYPFENFLEENFFFEPFRNPTAGSDPSTSKTEDQR